MSLTYLIAPLAIVGAFAYSYIARAQIRRAVARGQGPMLFHGHYAGYFPSLGRDEYIVTLWQGLAYSGSKSAAAQLASGLLNQVSRSAIGVSAYTPTAYAVMTTHGRVLVAEEHSQFGTRGHFREVGAWLPGSTAVTGPAAIPEHTGPAPANPFNPTVPMELAVLVSPDGSRYPLWLSPQGSGLVAQDRPISAALPAAPAQLAGVWHMAHQAGGTT